MFWVCVLHTKYQPLQHCIHLINSTWRLITKLVRFQILQNSIAMPCCLNLLAKKGMPWLYFSRLGRCLPNSLWPCVTLYVEIDEIIGIALKLWSMQFGSQEAYLLLCEAPNKLKSYHVRLAIVSMVV